MDHSIALAPPTSRTVVIFAYAPSGGTSPLKCLYLPVLAVQAVCLPDVVRHELIVLHPFTGDPVPASSLNTGETVAFAVPAEWDPLRDQSNLEPQAAEARRRLTLAIESAAR